MVTSASRTRKKRCCRICELGDRGGMSRTGAPADGRGRDRRCGGTPSVIARGAYAARGGWMSEREAMAVTYHRKFGQVATVSITPEMLEAGFAGGRSFWGGGGGRV